MAWAWHGKCESDTVTLCKSNGKNTFETLSGTAWQGTAWARHAMCESAFTGYHATSSGKFLTDLSGHPIGPIFQVFKNPRPPDDATDRLSRNVAKKFSVTRCVKTQKSANFRKYKLYLRNFTEYLKNGELLGKMDLNER
jgi:hypothetical protein